MLSPGVLSEVSELDKRQLNLDGFVPGNQVKVVWDRHFTWGRSSKKMPKTKTEGRRATVTKVTAKFVWVVVENNSTQTPQQKVNHNVSLFTPALGLDRVLVARKDGTERLLQRQRLT